MAIYMRLAKTADLTRMMAIIEEAKQLLKSDGSPQWQDGQPNKEMFANDIKLKRAYVLVVDQNIAGVATLMTTADINYGNIEGGSWHSNTQHYATIHRIALANDYRGQNLAKIFISNLLSQGYAQGIRNFRIDTHALNKRMQHLIHEFGYQYRGIIHENPTPDGARYAYELEL